MNDDIQDNFITLDNTREKVDNLLEQGRNAFTQKNFNEAEQYFLQVIEIDPNDATTYNDLGVLYSDVKHDYHKAEEYYHKALEIDPNNAITYTNLGILYEYEQDNLNKANEYYHKALELNSKNTPNKNNYVGFAFFTLIAGLGIIFFMKEPTIDTFFITLDALKNQKTSELSIGTLLKADKPLESIDHNITHSYTIENTKLYIWDYAAEDGDYIQIVVNGTLLGDAFMIKNKPRSFTVPTKGIIQIKGIRDGGGGGITYATHFDFYPEMFFNTTQNNNFNTYTLKYKP